MGAVEQYRPFLAPMFAWTSVVPQGACLVPPVMLRVVMRFLQSKFGQGPLVVSCQDEDSPVEIVQYWTDAAAEDGKAGIGGWEFVEGQPESQARWFFVNVTQEMAPWVFEKGKDQAFR
eukprot:7864971-Karenia_brevis.AAC.1